MRKQVRIVVCSVLGAAISLLLQGSIRAQEAAQQAAVSQDPAVSELAVSAEEHIVHVFPTVKKKAELPALGMLTTPLSYHGGPVMTKANTYAIYWIPPSLQTGAATSLSTHYQQVQNAFLSLYPGHGIDNDNTQYYQTSGSLIHFTTWIQNSGGFVASYVDTAPYPPSGCTDTVTPGNCLTDAQIQAEIQKVIALKGWPTGINNMFLLFTSSGEGSCAGTSCAYEWYCAYHSYFMSGTSPVIYGNEPYGNPNYCQVPGTPSPNGDAAADAAATVASHELTEAITDPELNAWYDGSGSEIGDKCAWIYGTNTWDSGKANQSWWESWSSLFLVPQIGYFELQEEYSNHANACIQVGP
jgi:hypothetical protein